MPGGFGTPVFGDRRRLRVDGVELVTEEAGGETRRRLDGVDAASTRALADFFAFATAVLEELARDHDASVIQIWPEHFDVALSLGDEACGARANYGASPGDEHHPEPYLYVGPWSEVEPGELWNATSFTGAELPYAALVAADDPYAVALEFYRARLR